MVLENYAMFVEGLDENEDGVYNRNFGVLVSFESARHAVKKTEGVRSNESIIIYKAALREV